MRVDQTDTHLLTHSTEKTRHGGVDPIKCGGQVRNRGRFWSCMLLRLQLGMMMLWTLLMLLMLLVVHGPPSDGSDFLVRVAEGCDVIYQNHPGG